MKKSFFFLAAFLFALKFNAQTEVDSYVTDYWSDRQTYKIEATETRGVVDRVWIEVRSLDKLNSEGYLIIEAKKLPDFISFLQISRDKYVEWTQTAVSNNVTDLRKEVDTDKFNTLAAFKYGKWQFDYHNILKSVFLVSKEKHLLVINTGELQSSGNQFMKNAGLVLVFSNAKEFDEFIAKLDINKFQEIISKDTQKADLFN